MDINLTGVGTLPSTGHVEAGNDPKANLTDSKKSAESLGEIKPESLIKAVDAADEASELTEEDTEELDSIVEELSDIMAMMKKGLEFKVDDNSGSPVVRVMDIDTGELIRQIPSEEALELAQKLQDVKGLLMRTEA